MFLTLRPFFFLSLILTLAASNQTFASPFILEELINMDAQNKKEIPLPNPVSLDPQWKDYFKVDGEELNRRIIATNDTLQRLFITLPIEDQNASLNLINKIKTALNALPAAKIKEHMAAQEELKPFLKSYTLEHQLELYKLYRKVKEEIKIETGHLDNLKDRLSKTQSHLDNLMVSYLGQGQPSAAKMLNGLEIMMHGTNAMVGEQRIKTSESRLEELSKKSKKLEEELDFAKLHLDATNFDQHDMEKQIAVFQKELENSKNEISKVESFLLGSFNLLTNDHSNQLFLEQQLLHAHGNHSYAWANLAYKSFKYNLLMYLNGLFHGHDELRKNLGIWRDKVSETSQQAERWLNATLHEQDRIRQEYTALVAKNEPADSSVMKVNNFQRQEVLNFLTTLELLKDRLADIEWLVTVLDLHFRNNSSFLENWALSISNFFTKIWDNTVSVLNYSLFKVSGIPITLFSLIKLLFICASSFWLAMKARFAILTFGKKSGDFSDSTLHIFGTLARYFILSIGFVLSLWAIGIDFSNLVFIIGALLFGISFGFQSIANNIFCGLRILFERKLQLGDDIELSSGHHGKVEEIHIQNTIVKTSDGQKVIVPNSEIIGNTLINWTRRNYDHRRLHIPFAVSSGSDKQLIRETVIEAAKRLPCTLKNSPDYSDPQVWLVHFDQHVLHFKLVVWVDYGHESFTDSKEADFLWEIESSLRDKCIELPSNIYNLLTNNNVKQEHIV